MIVAMRGVMTVQAQAFLKLFHQNLAHSPYILVYKLHFLVQFEVLPKIKEVVNLIISSAVEDPKALKVNSMASSSPKVEASIWLNLSRPSASPSTSSSSGGPIPWPILSKSTVLCP
ncbi:hypothetical protein BY996DRAFT_6414235 [Phakopsora pachyrhizi]|nr:hypothetical protein BY996DRAFT_6414235 [Phakopsora pachyrhizi]